MITSLLCLDICANSAVLFTCTCTWSCESACLLYSAHASHAIKSCRSWTAVAMLCGSQLASLFDLWLTFVYRHVFELHACAHRAC